MNIPKISKNIPCHKGLMNIPVFPHYLPNVYTLYVPYGDESTINAPAILKATN
jgi:hypothetical protein